MFSRSAGWYNWYNCEGQLLGSCRLLLTWISGTLRGAAWEQRGVLAGSYRLVHNCSFTRKGSQGSSSQHLVLPSKHVLYCSLWESARSSYPID